MLGILASAVLILAVVGTPGAASPVVAEVNGEVITRHDVEIVISSVFKQLEKRYEGEILEKKKSESFKQVVERLIEQRLLVQVAKERGIEVQEEDVDAQMEALSERVGGWAILLDMLAKVGISFDEKAKQVREGLMTRRLLSIEVLPSVYASPADIRRYYEERREEFTEPSKYNVRQIIVWRSRYATVEEVKKKLATIHAELKRGADFAEIARKYSDGPHAKDGGDWGFVGSGDLVEELGTILREMKAGEVKGPVETRVGFHFVKLIDIQGSVLRPFADVHRGIENMLRRRAYSLESEKYVKDLWRKGFVKVYEQASLSAE